MTILMMIFVNYGAGAYVFLGKGVVNSMNLINLKHFESPSLNQFRFTI